MHGNGGAIAARVAHDALQRRRPMLRLYGAIIDVADKIEEAIVHRRNSIAWKSI
jgi:hypothetical protein